MKKDLTLVILAAGMGSRFGGLKQVEPVGPNGEFILDYSVCDAIRAGYDKVVFIIKEENYDLFRETIGKRIESKIKVEYVFQKIEDVPEGGQAAPVVRKQGAVHVYDAMLWNAQQLLSDNLGRGEGDDQIGLKLSYMLDIVLVITVIYYPVGNPHGLCHVAN